MPELGNLPERVRGYGLDPLAIAVPIITGGVGTWTRTRQASERRMDEQRIEPGRHSYEERDMKNTYTSYVVYVSLWACNFTTLLAIPVVVCRLCALFIAYQCLECDIHVLHRFSV